MVKAQSQNRFTFQTRAISVRAGPKPHKVATLILHRVELSGKIQVQTWNTPIIRIMKGNTRFNITRKVYKNCNLCCQNWVELVFQTVRSWVSFAILALLDLVSNWLEPQSHHKSESNAMNFKPKQSSVDQILELEVSLVLPYQFDMSQHHSFSWITILKAARTLI